jgi:hypothetical protein
MPTRNVLSSEIRIAAIAFCFALLVFSGNGVWGSRIEHPQSTEPRVLSETNSLQLVSLIQSEGTYTLKLKNVSNKDINGYTIGAGAGGKLAVDLTIGSRIISPGDIIEEHIPVTNLQSSSSGTSSPASITILAVFFEDGTSDGFPEAIAETKYRRQGTKIQLTRILAILEASSSGGTDRSAFLRKLKEQVSSLPETSEDVQHPRIKAGLHSAKEDSLTKLELIEQSDVDIQTGILKLKEGIKKRIARLSPST